MQGATLWYQDCTYLTLREDTYLLELNECMDGWVSNLWKELAGYLCMSHLCFIRLPSRNSHVQKLSAFSAQMLRMIAWYLLKLLSNNFLLEPQQCCATYWAGFHRWIDIRFWGSAMPTDTTISAAHPWADVSHILKISAETTRQRTQASKCSDCNDANAHKFLAMWPVSMQKGCCMLDLYEAIAPMWCDQFASRVIVIAHPSLPWQTGWPWWYLACQA